MLREYEISVQIGSEAVHGYSSNQIPKASVRRGSVVKAQLGTIPLQIYHIMIPWTRGSLNFPTASILKSLLNSITGF